MKPHILKETWIGILGGGQLGRMLTMDARRMGYKVITWSDSSDPGPATLADEVICAPFTDQEAMEKLIARADVVTLEFENIPRDLLETLETRIPIYPAPSGVIAAQHREREKAFLSKHEIPCAWYQVIDSEETLAQALADLPSEEGILKTAEFGYDGKGQIKVSKASDPSEAWNAIGGRAVLEQRIELEAELSVIVVRNGAGECVSFEAAENRHRNHILDLSIIPGDFSAELLTQARELAVKIADSMDCRGVLAVEFFVGPNQTLLVNELAPRPHNSGHHTIDACETSQFEQQLRAICGLPLGSTAGRGPAVMWNLLGDLWADGDPDWSFVLATPGAHLHLYGKKEARVGRKMGHITFTGPDSLAHAMACRRHYGWDPEED